MTKAVYPGSLDPITYGHVSAIRDTAEAFGEAVVAIGINPAKNYMFSLAEREELARQATAHIPGVTVTSFSGLFVHFLVRNDLNVIVRGVRNGQDLDDAVSQEMLGWQQAMAKDIKAFYVPAQPGQTFTSSTAVKAILKDQGDATHLAPLSTIHATQARMLGQYMYGVTGVSGSGKSYVCRKFEEIGAKRHIPVKHIDMDKLGHAILGGAQEPVYAKIRQKIKDTFGPEVQDANGEIIRKKLGEIVFGNPDKLKQLNDIMHEPVFFRMNDLLRGQKGVFLIDAALLAETNRTTLVNNQMLLVEAQKENIADRLKQRDNLTPEQTDRRLSSQFSAAAKSEAIEKSIEEAHYGHLDKLVNGGTLTDADAEKAFDVMLQRIDIYGDLRIAGFLTGLGLSDAAEAYTAIRKLYGGNDRFHHTLARVVDGLNQMPDMMAHVQDKDAFTLAWLFQGSVFDPRRNDNDIRSAEMLEKLCTAWKLDAGLVARAKKLIIDSGALDEKSSQDAKLLADLSLSGLGEGVNGYQAYEKNIRREYNWLSSKEWAEQQNAFLRSLPAEGFYSDYFKRKSGAAARGNISRSLSRLEP